MLAIPLSQVPNQAISFNADDAIWTIHVYQTINFMCADIVRNGEKLIDGVRCFGGIPLMPYTYMYSPTFGNFIFDSDGDWTNFGGSCNLYYLPKPEFDVYQKMMSTLVFNKALSK